MSLLLIACANKTEVIYKSVYPSLPQLESPLVLKTNACQFIMPKSENEDIFVGFTKEQYKCYVKNQEIHREQNKLYEKFIQEINKERQKWSELNKTEK